MPHISKNPVSEKVLRTIDAKFISLLSAHTSKRNKILGQLLTETERVMLAKRLSIIFLITRGLSTHKISSLLKVSPSTVARFERKVSAGACTDLCEWLNTKNTGMSILETLVDVAMVPFDIQNPHSEGAKKRRLKYR